MSLLLFRPHKLEVEVVEQQREREPDCRLCESLTEAYTLATHEWSECKRVSRFAVSCSQPFVVLVLGVEAFWFEFLGFGPLSRVVLD